ncbi:MAG: glycosyltransferase [Gammaproteobacteria bacterium]
MSIQSGKHILCTWELGGGLGHLTRLANITRKLEQRNYRVTVAVRDLARATDVFAGTQARLLQAPVWLTRISLNRPIACMADTLLLLGYLEPAGLRGLLQGWRNLIDTAEPDLCLFDFSPTAILASHHRTIPKIRVGSGFHDPVPDHPIADWRPVRYNDDLVTRQEALLLEKINRALTLEQQSPLQRYTDIFRLDATVIDTFPALDIYGDVRSQGIYCPYRHTAPTLDPVIFPAGEGPAVIAYLQADNQHLKLHLEALRQCKARVFVVCPGGQDAILKPFASSRLHYSTHRVALKQGIADADLLVSHGAIGTLTEALAAGTPVLGIPTQMEQLLNLQKVQALGAGVLVDRIESAADLCNRINLALDTPALKTAAQDIANRQPDKPPTDAATTVADLCDQWLGCGAST